MIFIVIWVAGIFIGLFVRGYVSADPLEQEETIMLTLWPLSLIVALFLFGLFLMGWLFSAPVRLGRYLGKRFRTNQTD